jgi:hypothetical protein
VVIDSAAGIPPQIPNPPGQARSKSEKRRQHTGKAQERDPHDLIQCFTLKRKYISCVLLYDDSADDPLTRDDGVRGHDDLLTISERSAQRDRLALERARDHTGSN